MHRKETIATALAESLERHSTQLLPLNRQARAPLDELPLGNPPGLRYRCERSYRFSDDLHGYALTHP